MEIEHIRYLKLFKELNTIHGLPLNIIILSTNRPTYVHYKKYTNNIQYYYYYYAL